MCDVRAFALRDGANQIRLNDTTWQACSVGPFCNCVSVCCCFLAWFEWVFLLRMELHFSVHSTKWKKLSTFGPPCCPCGPWFSPFLFVFSQKTFGHGSFDPLRSDHSTEHIWHLTPVELISCVIFSSALHLRKWQFICARIHNLHSWSFTCAAC